MSERRGKKRPKSYYIKCAKKAKPGGGGRLSVGMKGFLVTCNKHEKEAVREMYNLLNEYADQLYGREKIKKKSDGGEYKECGQGNTEVQEEKEEEEECNSDAEGSEEEEEEDIEKAMNKEIKDIKDSQKTERRFQNTNTKVSNCIFIRTTLDDPCALVHHIFTDLASNKQQKTRSAIRLLPISNSCKAFDADIKKMAEKLFRSFFETKYGCGLTYTIMFKTRNNSSIGRDSVIPMLGLIIRDLNPLHRINHNNPDYTVLVEIVGNICCMSVVKDFFKFRKYNLHEVVKTRAEGMLYHTNTANQKEGEIHLSITKQECDKVQSRENDENVQIDDRESKHVDDNVDEKDKQTESDDRIGTVKIDQSEGEEEIRECDDGPSVNSTKDCDEENVVVSDSIEEAPN